ncbi:MAG: hypothetical protein ACFFG0_29775 [Candidatus Thorarchaeota archaeon]
MDEDNEKLIAKIQLEFTSGSSISIAKDETKWDIGLLYFTTRNLWFINSQREKTQIAYENLINVDNVKPRTSKRKTKFTKVLEANHIINIDFKAEMDNKMVIRTIQLSAAKEILKAFRSQMEIRLQQGSARKKGAHKLDKNELLRRLAVMLQMEITEEEKLEFFLGIPENEIVNLMIERNRIMKKAV